MSDADWDMEYSLAHNVEQEIIKLCKENNIELPVIKPYARSWELKLILSKLVNKNCGNCSVQDYIDSCTLPIKDEHDCLKNNYKHWRQR